MNRFSQRAEYVSKITDERSEGREIYFVDVGHEGRR